IEVVFFFFEKSNSSKIKRSGRDENLKFVRVLKFVVQLGDKSREIQSNWGDFEIEFRGFKREEGETE
ncbi:hypothetical protein GIB67_041022, partial [Kingdonia uniflora]